MENKVNLSKEIEINSTEEPEEKMLLKIFCPLCYQFPEYSIKFISSSNFRLVHECLGKKIIEINIDFEKDSKPFNFKCFYCKKDCKLVCARCKYLLCQKCSKKHNQIPELENDFDSKYNPDKNSVINIMNNQYICKNHLLEFQFYCPVCKINLCKYCKKEHFHINCPELKYQKFISKEINEPSNVCFKKLFILAKLFYDCYNKNFLKIE